MRELVSPYDEYAWHLQYGIILFVEQKHGVRITTGPSKRMMAGFSTCTTAAVKCAWPHPGWFGLVLSVSVSHASAGLAGLQMPALFRRTLPRKPLRVFLLVGSGDFESDLGSWREHTEILANAPQHAGCDYQFRLGEGAGHSPRFQSSILTECLLFLFNSSSAAGAASASKSSRLRFLWQSCWCLRLYPPRVMCCS